MWSLLVILTMLGLIAAGIPVAFSVGFVTILIFLLKGSLIFAAIPQYMYEYTAIYGLIAAPMFMLAGLFMEEGGISRRLVNFGLVLVGRFKGGLGHASILAGMFMGGISGSAIADSSAIGAVSIPAMINRKYPVGYVVALMSLCGAIGVIIPPSIPMIVLATISNLSIGDLFLGGAIPGIITGFSMMILNYYFAHRLKWVTEPKASMREIFRAFVEALPTIAIPFAVIIGILGGILTVTEVSVVIALYSFILGYFIYGELNISRIPTLLLKTVEMVSSVLIVLAFCGVLAWVVIYDQIPDKLAESLMGITTNKTIILFIFVVISLILGCVMDMIPNITILAPVCLPIIIKLGIDPIFFGVLLVYVLALGLTTPPVGATLFVACAMAKVPQHVAYFYVLAFIILGSLIATLLIIFPQLILFLPNLAK